MTCRGCGAPLAREDALCDLGVAPLANALLTEVDLDLPEAFYPLRPLVCRQCLLVQLPACIMRDVIFPASYPFFAGQSQTWVKHCADFADHAVEEFHLKPSSRVLEIGSNDGTMLRRFRERGIPAVGVEPCEGVAQHANMEGLPTIVDWWGKVLAGQLCSTMGEPTGLSHWQANLVVATNVLAHVPDLYDFLQGVDRILAPGGTVVFEVPAVGNLIADSQFDQIYAEHHCYFSLHSLLAALHRVGLHIYDVERIPTHGGSYRVYVTRATRDRSTTYMEAIGDEVRAGLTEIETYTAFANRPAQVKQQAWARLTRAYEKAEALDHPLRVVGYGASAKATTFLNYLGMGPETIEFIADTTPAKWGKYIPGVRIPIVPPAVMQQEDPDVVILFAWNWATEATPKIKAACPRAEVVTLREPTVSVAPGLFRSTVPLLG